jgi:hypothetical protein
VLSLHPVIVGIELAEGPGIAAPMLVIALIGGNEGVVGNVARAQVGIKAVLAFEAHHVLKTVSTFLAFLHAFEIDERIVFYGLEGNQIALRQWWSQLWQYFGEVGAAGVLAVTIIHEVGAAERQAFLIALP